MPLLGQPSQQRVVDFLRDEVRPLIARSKPKALLVFSAHWEVQGGIHVSSMRQPDMIFDYYGFPPEVGVFVVDFSAPAGRGLLICCSI